MSMVNWQASLVPVRRRPLSAGPQGLLAGSGAPLAAARPADARPDPLAAATAAAAAGAVVRLLPGGRGRRRPLPAQHGAAHGEPRGRAGEGGQGRAAGSEGRGNGRGAQRGAAAERARARSPSLAAGPPRPRADPAGALQHDGVHGVADLHAVLDNICRHARGARAPARPWGRRGRGDLVVGWGVWLLGALCSSAAVVVRRRPAPRPTALASRSPPRPLPRSLRWTWPSCSPAPSTATPSRWPSACCSRCPRYACPCRTPRRWACRWTRAARSGTSALVRALAPGAASFVGQLCSRWHRLATAATLTFPSSRLASPSACARVPPRRSAHRVAAADGHLARGHREGRGR
jgi:hypothetical protein